MFATSNKSKHSLGDYRHEASYMLTLAPASASNIRAIYNSKGHYLELKAKGMIPNNFFTPHFAQKKWEGGLRFSLLTNANGLVHHYNKPFEAKHKLHVSLPLQSFDNKSVLIHTSLGFWEIPIQYTGSPSLGEIVTSPSVYSKSRYRAVSKDVLPPIRKHLARGHNLVIQASIPDTTSEVKPLFNPEYIRMTEATFNNNFITWKFSWTRLPSEGESPQVINILTRTGDGKYGTTTSIQGYIVEGVSPRKSQSRVESRVESMIEEFIYEEEYY